VNRRICSVWSWPELRYHYFAAPSLLDLGEDATPPEPRGRLRPPLGDPPELLLRELPPGSLYLGRGPVAHGEIVTRTLPPNHRWVR
jgi:hypothetical protein